MKLQSQAVAQATSEMGPIGSDEDVKARARILLAWWRRGSPRIVMPRSRLVPASVGKMSHHTAFTGARPNDRGILPDGLGGSLAAEGRSWRRLYVPDVAFTRSNYPHASGFNRSQRRAAERAGERLATVDSVEEVG